LLSTLLVAYQLNYFGLKKVNVPVYSGFKLDEICEDELKTINFCTVQQGSSNKIFLIGDSHAKQLFKPISNLSDEYKLSLVYSEKLQSVSRLIVENREKPIVIFSKYYTEKNFIDVRNDLIWLKKNSKLIVISQAPTFPDETLFMNQRSILNKLYSPPKYFAISKLISEDFKLRSKLLKFLQDGEFQFLDPYTIFCDNTICNRFDESGWLYFDDDHLSEIGALKLEKPIESLMVN
jgi:hypothetical protein